MKRPHGYILFLLVILSCAVAPISPQAHAPGPFSQPADKDAVKAPDIRIGIISYWELSSPAWDRIPANSLVLINPHDGILNSNDDKPVPDAAEWVQLFDRLKKKNVMVLGYVPTGYFDHVSCKKTPKQDCQTEPRIRRQVETYYKLIPSLAGIFYDETSPQPEAEATADYGKEYEMLRSINMPGRITVFNVGWSSDKAVDATKLGEHLVLYESSPYGYHEDEKQITATTLKARNRGITVWHLMHSVCSKEDMCSYVAKMAERGANYGYVTNIGGDWQAGENTWGSLPPYWEEELAAFSAPGKPCDKK